MDEVDLGTTKCNRNATSDWDAWWLPKSWDDAQNCVHGCISRMNEKSWDKACCGFQQQRIGDTLRGCIVYNAVDVIEGDENSKYKKAVNCKGTLGLC